MEKDKQIQKITEIIKEHLKGVLQIEIDILAEALYKKGCRIVPCAIGFDYIDGYKLGFKEGVEAVKTQLKERRKNGKLCIKSDGKPVFPELIVVSTEILNEICKELEGENDG